MSKFSNALAASFGRQKEILLHARRMFAGESISAFDAVVIVVMLMLLTAAQKLLWAVQTRTPTSALDVLQPMFLAVLLGWGGMSSLTYYVGRAAKHLPNFTQIVILMGAAGLPLVISTGVSVLVTLACVVLGVKDNLETWQWVHTITGTTGLLFSWPGYFSALAMEKGAEIKRTSALLISLVLVIFLVVGSLLPLFVKLS